MNRQDAKNAKGRDDKMNRQDAKNAKGRDEPRLKPKVAQASRL